MIYPAFVSLKGPSFLSFSHFRHKVSDCQKFQENVLRRKHSLPILFCKTSGDKLNCLLQLHTLPFWRDYHLVNRKQNLKLHILSSHFSCVLLTKHHGQREGGRIRILKIEESLLQITTIPASKDRLISG